MCQLFISHSSKDHFAAIAIPEWLVSEGWDDLFLDLDPARAPYRGFRTLQSDDAGIFFGTGALATELIARLLRRLGREHGDFLPLPVPTRASPAPLEQRNDLWCGLELAFPIRPALGQKVGKSDAPSRPGRVRYRRSSPRGAIELHGATEARPRKDWPLVDLCACLAIWYVVEHVLSIVSFGATSYADSSGNVVRWPVY
jgi:hypothetical protein